MLYTAQFTYFMELTVLQSIDEFGAAITRYVAEDPLKNVRLAHFAAPGAARNPECLPTLVSKPDFEVVSPAGTGMSAADLEAYFARDMRLKGRSFRHPQLYPSRGHRWSHVPLYSSFGLCNLFENPVGVEGDATAGQYRLIARTIDGELAGFVEAQLQLHSGREMAVFDGQMDPLEKKLYFHFELKRVYTCARFRGEGVFSTLAQTLAHAYLKEIRFVDDQVNLLNLTTPGPVHLRPTFEAEVESRSGYLAANILYDCLVAGTEIMEEENQFPNLRVHTMKYSIGFDARA